MTTSWESIRGNNGTRRLVRVGNDFVLYPPAALQIPKDVSLLLWSGLHSV